VKKPVFNHPEAYLPSLPSDQGASVLFCPRIRIFVRIWERFDDAASEAAALECCAPGDRDAPG